MQYPVNDMVEIHIFISFIYLLLSFPATHYKIAKSELILIVVLKLLLNRH